ncbi:DNA topoisomerase 2 [Coemansia brasiliensis]|uniref:DNA topoisomerase 2 n=1 Tax=Coemansia brasiliensis TaxID=2650707 RepID=A0A9W8IB50_9FUNG|nr:DNA topoisomerase 2 [Coemansia brasiliensis]
MSDFESDGSSFELDASPVKLKSVSKTKPASKASSSSNDQKGPSVEEIYQKKTPVEHVLLRPDTYIGSVEPIDDEMWVLNSEKTRMVKRKLHYTPGLYKIVDEILVNAADNRSRDSSMKKIEVTIDQAEGVISILNDGKGIPVELHRDQNVYVPELIFGHLLTSSNYNDNQEKTTGGRNGYGAKLCNIFSREFIVETADANTQKKYVQVFTDNMKNMGKPKITKHSTKKMYTKITFKPDFAKFHMSHLDDDAVALITKRVYDMAGCVEGVRVVLNGEVIPIKNFKSYVEMYLLPPTNPDDPVPPRAPTIVHKRFSDRWEVAFAVSDGQFNQVSFVNSINTLRGGTHVNYIADQITKNFIASLKKSKTTVKPFQVKNNMWLFVNCRIVNPTFDSQTKETLTLRTSAFGSKCEITEDFMKGVMRSDLKEYVDMMVRRKEERELKKTDGTRTSRITGIDKLDDANLAGTRYSKECTLILTEGDSAKTLAVSGLGVQGRDRFGIFALRGKPLNVRDATATQISANQEFTNIKQILGLKHGTKYMSTDQLRYGHVMIMTDQDTDGSHIKGLLINMFDSMYPGLLEVDNFLQQFITPVVRVTHKRTKERVDFYTEMEFKKWYSEQPNSAKGWVIKYYKGLGTSKESDAHEYFRKLDFHRKKFETARPEDRKLLDMAFSKTKADARKEWLAAYQPGVWIDNNKSSVYIDEFINKELVLFSMDDNARSIPSVVDGLKPGQRKILWTALEANLKDEIKVVSLQGKVTEKAMYHHGDQSLIATIVNMAQDFVGSNNINLLIPEGGFGTRLAGGKDAASARYISTYLNKITRSLFHKDDDPLLESLTDDGKLVEPRWYIPVIPMVLVNGAEGIGTGWSTTIPNYNPSDIIANIRRLMRQEPLQPMTPWYRGFRGTIEHGEAGRFRTVGVIEKISDTELHISELPIRVWTESYKALLNKWMAGDKCSVIIRDFRYNASTLTVDITLTLTPEQMQAAESAGFDKHFKLSSTITMTNMVCFDREGRLRRYGSAEEIIEDFYSLRLRYYQLRKENMAEKLGQDLQRADNRARFVMEIIQKKLVVNNRKRKDIIDELRNRKYTPMPKKVAAAVAGDLESEQAAEQAESEEASDYDYLLSMPIWNLTMEKVEKLLKEKSDIQQKLEDLLALTPIDIWNADLDNVEAMWNVMVDEYEQRLEEDEENRKGQKGGGGGRGRARGKAAAKKSTAAAKRKLDPLGVKKEDEKPAILPATKARKLGGGTAKSLAPSSKLKPDPDASPQKQSVASTPTAVPTPSSAPITLGSDLDDSDEDVTAAIFKKAAAKKQSQSAKQTTLSSMLSRKSENAASAPAKAAITAAESKPAQSKPAAKRKLQSKRAVADSDDDDDGGGFGLGSSDDDMESPMPKRQPTARRAAASRKPVYMDISDGSDGSDDDFQIG